MASTFTDMIFDELLYWPTRQRDVHLIQFSISKFEYVVRTHRSDFVSLPVNAWNTANVGTLDNPTFCNRMCYNVPIMHPTPYNGLNRVY